MILINTCLPSLSSSDILNILPLLDCYLYITTVSAAQVISSSDGPYDNKNDDPR